MKRMKVLRELIFCVFLITVIGLEAHEIDNDDPFGAGQHEHPNPLFGEAKPPR